jgi:hypothetical protein
LGKVKYQLEDVTEYLRMLPPSKPAACARYFCIYCFPYRIEQKFSTMIQIDEGALLSNI